MSVLCRGQEFIFNQVDNVWQPGLREKKGGPGDSWMRKIPMRVPNGVKRLTTETVNRMCTGLRPPISKGAAVAIPFGNIMQSDR